MANVAINEQHLVDIAQAIREKSGIPEGTPIMEISKTPNVTDKETANTSTGYGNGRNLFDTATIPGASTIQVELTIHTESTNYDYLQILPGTVTTAAGFSGATKYGGTKKTTHNLTFENTDTVSFYFKSDSSNCSFFGYYAEVTGLDANGELITDGVPAETFRPGDMAAAIAAIELPQESIFGATLENVEVTATITGGTSNASQINVDLSPYIGTSDVESFLLTFDGGTNSQALTDVGIFYNGSTFSEIFGASAYSGSGAASVVSPERCSISEGIVTITFSKNLILSGSNVDILYMKDNGNNGGIVPEGELQITKNDTYDVTDYATVVVNVEGSGGDAGGAGGAITAAHKTAATTLSDGTMTFDLSDTGGNFTLLLATTSASKPYQVFCFNNGAITKQNMYHHEVGRLYGLTADTSILAPTYSNGVLTIPVASDGVTTLMNTFVTFFYVATA